MPKQIAKHKWLETVKMVAPSGRVFEVDNDEDYIATLQQLGWTELPSELPYPKP